jgi:tetratricopeptide (TPR) repeat protein
MTEPASLRDSHPETLRDRYTTIIEELLASILGGKQIISKGYIQRVLSEQVLPGSSEVIEGCLQEQLTATQTQLTTETSEVKQAKLGHKVRAIEMIGTVLTEWQQERQASETVNRLIGALMVAAPADRLGILFQAIDRNQPKPLNSDQLQQIAKDLQRQQPENLPDPEQISAIATGLTRGLAALVALEPHLVSWIYESSQGPGFSTGSERGPWMTWADRSGSQFVSLLLASIARQEPIPDFFAINPTADTWVELALVLQGIQVGLVRWFDQQPYDLNWGKRMSFSTLLTFASLWCDLANKVNNYPALSQACFQITLQILRTATQRSDFPLYGGIFATLNGDSFHKTLTYFDQPLKQVTGTQEKGRILTVLGYSQGVLGNPQRAIELYEEALLIANTAADRPCEIANLNHLSRIYLHQQDYEKSIGYSQRALVLARQNGDRRGEANALTNYGFGEVLAAQSRDEMEPEVYEQNIGYLERGMALAKSLEDLQSLALCTHSLGRAYLAMQQWPQAVEYLTQGIRAAQSIGDLYLQGMNIAYLAEAYYGMQDPAALVYAALGMYQLHQIEAREWRKSAGLLRILCGGQDLETAVGAVRSQLLPVIGVDGYDYLPEIMTEYGRSM